MNNYRLVETHVIKIKDGKIFHLALKRSDKVKYPGVWQPITGHVEENEKAFETAIREIKEETGFVPEKIYSLPIVNSFYHPRTDSVWQIPVFLCVVPNEFEPEISSEHSEYLWGDAKNVKRLYAWPGQRKSVDLIEDYFGSDKSFLHFLEIKI